MGVCYSNNDRKIRQKRLTNKTVYKISENKILNNSKESNNKQFGNFKEKEINLNCENFYNINNNFNYSIIDNNNNKNLNNKGDESISIPGLNLMNQPIENLSKENMNKKTSSINQAECNNNDTYQKLLSYFTINIHQFPYNGLTPNQINSHENQYISSKKDTSYKFIESKKYEPIFIKIYELCFLKCEPLLNNINDNKKTINLLFLRTVIILLREKYLDKMANEIANSIIELSYGNNNKFLNKGILYKNIKNYCEVCYQILFYFIIAYSQFTEEQYLQYLNNENILIQDKYSNIDIDIFCLNTIFDNSKGSYKFDEIIEQWSDFICGKINNLNEFDEENFKKNEVINVPIIKKKIIYMVNPYHLLQTMVGINLPNNLK